jgi:hypothetical protein
VQLDDLAAQLVPAGRHAERRDGVADQGDPATRRLHHHLADGRVDVVEVGNQPAGQAGVGERLPGDARLAVVQAALGVEDVGDHARARLGGGRDLLGERVGVPHRHQHAGAGQALGRLDRALPLRRQRDQGEDLRAGLHEPVDPLGGGVDQVAGVVRTSPARREERALQVHAQQAAAAGPLAGRRLRGSRPGHRRRQVGDRRADEGGERRGHAGGGQPAQDALPARLVRVHQVDAEGAVELEIDQPGSEHAPVQPEMAGTAGRAPVEDAGDPAVLDRDGAWSGRVAPGDHAGS